MSPVFQSGWLEEMTSPTPPPCNRRGAASEMDLGCSLIVKLSRILAGPMFSPR